MSDINYVVGDATRPQAETPAVIAHVCNNAGQWGAGFVLALSRRWNEPEREYRRWIAASRYLPPPLRETQFVVLPDEPGVLVANMVAQDNKTRRADQPWLDYPALRSCLTAVGRHAKALRASVHMPRIGCGIAGGTWDKVEPIIRDTLVAAGVPVFVYDLPEKKS